MQKQIKAIEIVDHITIISIIGVAACAVGYFLFFQWLAYSSPSQAVPAYDTIAPGLPLTTQPVPVVLNFRSFLPALLSVIGFMYAIFRTIPVLEDFWGLQRTRINTQHPICVYIAIGMWLVFMNSLMIAFGHQLEFGASFPAILENFFGRYGNDTEHYIAIAQRWYQNTLDEHRLVIVFFPFYSILIRIMYFVSPTYLFAAWFISNAFAYASGVMLYKLARLITEESEARNVVKFIFIFPSAFFFFVPLTESLFLFLSVAVLYYTIKEKYVHVFIFGLMAALTRSAGLLLIIPVACELIRQLIADYRADESHQNFSAFWHTVRFKYPVRLLSLTSFLLGISIYLFINYAVYGSATQFMVFQEENWYQSLYYFWHTITYLFDAAADFRSDWAIGLAIPGVIVFGLVLGLTAYGAKHIRVSFTLYALAYFIFAFGPTWLMSGPRYAAVLFPIAFVAAKIAGKKKGYNLVLTIAYLVMFALYFHEFVRDNFVF
ncbi:MAG: hypothetical protein FWE42_05515 [Defluviitaleaceae bacterium]|nr:hypothetical protein [Defluviitaleaceae bacterium]